MIGRILFAFICIFISSVISIHAEEELVFEPLTSGNFAIMYLNQDEVFLINTGSSSSQSEVKKYLRKLEDKHIKGILISKVNEQNCGNLEMILNDVEVDNLYLPKNNKELCKVPEEFKKQTYFLSKNERIAISSKYYIDHIYSPDTESSHIAISNGHFICYWYEGAINHELWNQETQVIYLTDSPSANLTEEDLVKLDPEVAIINRKGEIRSLIELFQKQWVDIYALRRGVSAHITIMQDDYELYLKRE